MTLPHGAYTENLANVLRFRHYLSTHLESFYKYVINKRGRKVRNGDVRLVIGCVKASSWGMATFLDSTASDFYLKFKVTSESRLMQAYGWEHSGLVEAKAGPDPEETEELRSSDNSVHSRKYNNQCLFLSTTNAKLGDEVWQRLAFGFEMPMDQSESYSNPSSFSSSAPPHPSKAMNDFILSAVCPQSILLTLFSLIILLQNPQARIAIIEDEDWTSLIAKVNTCIFFFLINFLNFTL